MKKFYKNELLYGYFSKVLNMNFRATEVVDWKCSIKNVFLKMPQNSSENTCAGVSFKKRLQHRCFSGILGNVSRTFKMAASGTTMVLINSQ